MYIVWPLNPSHATLSIPLGGSSLSNASESGISTSIACIEYNWPGLLCPATYCMHFVQSSLDMMYCGVFLAILRSIGMTIATVSPFFGSLGCLLAHEMDASALWLVHITSFVVLLKYVLR